MIDHIQLRRPSLPLLVVAIVAFLSLVSVGIVAADGPVVGPNTTFEASDDGPTVIIKEELELDDPFYYPDDHTVDLSPHATFISDGDTNVTVEQITGEFTELSTHDVAAGLEIDPGDKQAVTLTGESITAFDFAAVDTATATNAEVVYDAEEGFQLTVMELPADTDIDAIDVNTDNTVDTQTADGDGVATFDLPSSNSDRELAFAEEEEEEEEEVEPDPEANFDVTINDTNSPVDVGETATVEANVFNAGDATGTQTIEFNVSDHAANQSVSIAPGNTEEVTFEWETTSDDIGSHTATVASEDDADSTTISVSGEHPVFVSGYVADETPSIVNLTFDQGVFVDDADPTDGFAVAVDGASADLDSASTSDDRVDLALAERIEDGENILVSYDGQSDNVVNEHDLEALAFETGDIDNQVEVFQANLSAIDPTTNERSNRFSIETTVADGVILSAEDSILPPGQEATFDWEVGDESFTTTEPTLDRQFFEPGVYNASVTITVADRIRSAIFTLEVVDETPPDARLTAAETVEIGDDPNLDASESSDNVAIADFEWDFGDGTTDSGANLTQPEHSFDEAGEYEVTVTVTDTSGNSAQNSTTITVEEEPDEGMDVLPIGLALLVVAALGVAGYYYMRRR